MTCPGWLQTQVTLALGAPSLSGTTGFAPTPTGSESFTSQQIYMRSTERNWSQVQGTKISFLSKCAKFSLGEGETLSQEGATKTLLPLVKSSQLRNIFNILSERPNTTGVVLSPGTAEKQKSNTLCMLHRL